jgi:hypothetical protein
MFLGLSVALNVTALAVVADPALAPAGDAAATRAGSRFRPGGFHGCSAGCSWSAVLPLAASVGEFWMLGYLLVFGIRPAVASSTAPAA